MRESLPDGAEVIRRQPVATKQELAVSGTGLLGRGLQEYLRAHPNVASVRYGNADEGGSGVTVFELR